jgi:hypothetical protein
VTTHVLSAVMCGGSRLINGPPGLVAAVSSTDHPTSIAVWM